MSSAIRSTEATPTVAVEMERNLLGTIFVDNGVVHAVASIVSPKDFFSRDYAKVFGCILEMGSAIDPYTVSDALRRTGEREPVTVSEMTDMTIGVVPASARRYAQAIKEASIRRRGIAISERAIAHFSDFSQPVADGLRLANDDFLDLLSGSTADHPTVPALKVADAVLGQISARRKRADSMVGLPFGLAVLDEFTGGIANGEFVIVAARPSVGKTSLAVQATKDNARAGRGVFVFSAEMTKEQFFSRMLAQVSRVPALRIRRSYLLTDEEEKLLGRSSAEIASWPWYIADRSNPHISEVVSRAVAAVKRHKCELIVLDHLQKIRGDGDSDTERVSSVSAALTQLAKDYAPVIALSQLARPADHAKGKWPTMLDLRGSGMLEADAHIIVMLHRELDANSQYTSKGYAIVEKQREGMTGALNVHFDTDLLRFAGA